ncbi:MAG: O-antigen ligase family protein, partial [Verrucomicrobiota bacterium]|nr:O-antigen ligase family protein [Verrucomicrobiota bacterium]
NERGFGPFPNRNQTGDLLGLSAIVIIACGQDDIRHGRKRWLFWLAGFAMVICAIVLNFSRAGLVIVIAGSALWLGALVFRSGSGARMAMGLSALLVLLTAVLLFGGQTLERFHFRGADGAGVTSDFRWLIFRDAFALIHASPWCGIGLGNFSPVFAVFREASLNQNRALHPESDWLWLAAEVGWPAVVLVLVGAVMLVRRMFPFAEGTGHRLRLAAAIAALLFGAHGLVDVSAHRVGSAYAGLLLCGLALHRPFGKRASRTFRAIFRGAGCVFLALGATWLIAAARGFDLPGGLGVAHEKKLAADANVRRDFAQTIVHASRALEWAPLDWQLYFLRAIGKAGTRPSPEDALDDFRRARFLEPASYEVPYQEGLTWIARDPILTMTAWREALRRAGPERAALYARMLSSAVQLNPRVAMMLQDFGSAQPELALIILERANGESFNATIERLLTRDPALATLKPEQKSRLFALWTERGDPERLVSLVAAQPDLLPFAWRGVAKARAAQQNFRGAVELAKRFAKPPALPPVLPNETIEQLQQKIFASRNDYGAGLALFQKQMATGKTDDALITVRRFTEDPNAPAYFHFLEAQAWAANENWERAWNAWAQFEKTR